MNFNNQTIKIIFKIVTYLVIICFFFSIGYILKVKLDTEWLIKKLDEGFPTILTGFIGFTGLILTTWWAGRQNSIAIAKSALIDRELEELKWYEQGHIKAAYLVQVLKELKIHIALVKEMMEEIHSVPKHDIIREAENRLKWIRDHVLESDLISPPPIFRDPNFCINIGVAATVYCLKIESHLKTISIAFEAVHNDVIDRCEAISQDCSKSLEYIDLTIRTYEPLIPNKVLNKSENMDVEL
ncbi:MAG: hypothetical protein JJ879_10900 [Sneathiella sp.]|nr:hypothetical protein [Sneathiella sp.]